MQERLDIQWKEQELAQIHKLEYLGAQITSDGRLECEGSRKIHEAKIADIVNKTEISEKIKMRVHKIILHTTG